MQEATQFEEEGALGISQFLYLLEKDIYLKNY
jgi:hypothetical protein